MNRRYIIPLIILVILILLVAFRWDVQATKSYSWSVAKWEKDRWTGEVWLSRYSPDGSEVTPTLHEEERIGPITTALTVAWWVLLAGDLAWLLGIFMGMKGKEAVQN